LSKSLRDKPSPTPLFGPRFVLTIVLPFECGGRRPLERAHRHLDLGAARSVGRWRLARATRPLVFTIRLFRSPARLPARRGVLGARSDRGQAARAEVPWGFPACLPERYSTNEAIAVSDLIITPDMTMEAILEAVPSGQRALFQRYHVGGCSSCGFQPTDTLAQVCKDHNILDVNEVVEFLRQANELDQKIQLTPTAVKALLDKGEDFSFIDVRSGEELDEGEFPPAEPMDYDNSQKYMELPKDRRIVFACLEGDRALNVSAYFRGHGFQEVYCLKGGIRAWKNEIDATVLA
jgi:rhodanese-related sulfurtransferase